MKFKHSFLVFIDNFSVIYKQLLYRLVIYMITWTATYFIARNFIKTFLDSEAFNAIWESVKQIVQNFLKGEISTIPSLYETITQSFEQLKVLLQNSVSKLIISVLVILLIHLVGKWLAGLGNYATCALVNDKMALHADLPFFSTLILNLKSAALFNLIYAPLSVLYDCVVCVILALILYALVSSAALPVFFAISLFTLLVIIAISVKMTFTSDWLPSLVRGKLSQKEAIKYAFSRKNKSTLNVLSNYIVLVLIVFAINMMAIVFTLGAGTLITIPASFVVLIVFELVNYYDREQIKYFVDKNTVIRPAVEKAQTREQFFLGDGE